MRTIGQDLVAVKPMSIKDAARGREIREFPQRYDDFDGIPHLEEYLKMIDKPGYVFDVAMVQNIPINTSETVYYTGSPTITISQSKPRDSVFDDIVIGGAILELNPEYWDIIEVNNVIDKINTKES